MEGGRKLEGMQQAQAGSSYGRRSLMTGRPRIKRQRCRMHEGQRERAIEREITLLL
jgi:hypothetical protein